MADTNFSSGTVIASTWLDDVNTSTYSQLTAVAGTDAITATGPLSMSAYAVGQRFFFIPVANNTGAVTINISGLGVKAITKFGFTSLVAQDLLTGVIAEMAYDGTEFQLINPQTFNLTNIVPITNGGTGATTAAQALINLGAIGRLIGTQRFTANGVYTPTAGTTSIIVEAVGGGGGGGGTPGTAAGQVSIGGGGGSGAYTKGIFTSGFAGLAVTIGAAGTAGAAVAGGVGGTTSLGAIITAIGGAGGTLGGAAAVVAPAGVAGGAASGVGGNILACSGNASEQQSARFADGFVISGHGAASALGGFGAGAFTNAGAIGGVVPPVGAFGGGGSGGGSIGAAGATGGGGGRSGILVIYEYS